MKLASSITRRSFIRTTALAAFGALAAACTPQPTVAPTINPNVPAPMPTNFLGEITFYAGSYTPNSARTWGAQETTTREALAALAIEWSDLHPNYKLTFVQAPTLIPLDTWITSQILLDTGPDIFTSPLPFLNKMAALKAVIPINDYLAQPNSYCPVSSWMWGDYFSKAYFASAGAHGVLGGVPLDHTATGIYVNLNLMEQAGIDVAAALDPTTGAPPDWATLLDWCARLKTLGVMPFSMATSVLDGWLQGVLADQFLWGLTERFDVLNYHPVAETPNQVGQVSQEEIMMQMVCNNWQPFAEPAVRGMYELIKGLVPYLPVGNEANSIMSYSWDYFMQGQLALLWDGCWLVRDLTQNIYKGFEWTSFWLPPVTTASSSFAHQPPIQPREIDSSFDSAVGINVAAIKRGNLEECVDWLMFITTPSNDARIVNEVPTLLPAVRGAAIQLEISKLNGGQLDTSSAASHTWPAPIYWFGLNYNQFTDTFQREMTIYLHDEGSLDDFMAKADQAARETTSAMVARNSIQYDSQGTWDLTQWPCVPAIEWRQT
jgi:raffinose/stachyose/melibiose transport system substrate-binding protein